MKPKSQRFLTFHVLNFFLVLLISAHSSLHAQYPLVQLSDIFGHFTNRSFFSVDELKLHQFKLVEVLVARIDEDNNCKFDTMFEYSLQFDSTFSHFEEVTILNNGDERWETNGFIINGDGETNSVLYEKVRTDKLSIYWKEQMSIKELYKDNKLISLVNQRVTVHQEPLSYFLQKDTFVYENNILKYSLRYIVSKLTPNLADTIQYDYVLDTVHKRYEATLNKYIKFNNINLFRNYHFNPTYFIKERCFHLDREPYYGLFANESNGAQVFLGSTKDVIPGFTAVEKGNRNKDSTLLTYMQKSTKLPKKVIQLESGYLIIFKVKYE